MQEFNIATINSTNFVIPENTFRLDPATYAFADGKLKAKPSYQVPVQLGLGFFSVALGIVYFTLLIFNRGGDGVLPGFMFLLGLTGMGALYIRKGLQALKLERSRLVLLGELVSIKGEYVPNQGKGWLYVVTADYKFDDAAGVSLYRSAQCQRDDLRDMSLPEPGTPVVVLYRNPQDVKMC